MRSQILPCAVALSLALGGMGGTALAQSRGPPAAAAAESIGDIARREDLDQRLQVVQQRLAERPDGSSAQMLAQARTLQARLRVDRTPSDQDLDAIEAMIQRMESAVR